MSMNRTTNLLSTKTNAIRFGMGAIKGVGRSAVEAIVEERKENGSFRSVFDMAKRIDLSDLPIKKLLKT